MRVKTDILAWMLGATFGAMVAAFLGPFVPSWGLALAPVIAVSAFAAGAITAPRDRLVGVVLRASTAFSVGFAAVLIPLTLDRLGRSAGAMADARDVLGMPADGSVEAALTLRWIALLTAFPIGIMGVFASRRRDRG